MVARTRRMMNGFVLPLVLGSLLLFTAVTLAVPVLVPVQAYPGDPVGTENPGKSCYQRFGPPGDAGSGCCTYTANTCFVVGTDPNIQNGATGAYFRTDQWREWGECQNDFTTGSITPKCTFYPQYVCARINYYNPQGGNNCAILKTGFWVLVGPDKCNPNAPGNVGN